MERLLLTRRRLAAVIVMPADTPSANEMECQAFGANVQQNRWLDLRLRQIRRRK